MSDFNSQNNDPFKKVRDFINDTEDETSDYEARDIEKNKTNGILAYFFFFIPLLVCPDSKFGKFHANQSLSLFIVYVASFIVQRVLRLIPILGILFSLVTGIILLSLTIIGMVYAYHGAAKELPVIGGFRLLK